MNDFNWKCPHCEHAVTIAKGRYSASTHRLWTENADGRDALVSEFIVCPNDDCRKYTLWVTLWKTVSSINGAPELSQPVRKWQIVPWGSARSFPDFVPQAIRDDYAEACSIVSLSPKAAATLARRAVQGIVRGYWKIARSTLNKELEELKDHIGGAITQETWDSIDAVRSIGNIGAHMEKDINVIVDVEPEEAELLIGLVENLIEDTYIAADARAQRYKNLMALKAEKEAAKLLKPAP